MIQSNSFLSVIDNSGVKQIKCIKILGGSFNNGLIGSIIKVAVQKVLPNRKIKAGEVVNALILRLKKTHRRKDGMYIKFFSNDAILLNTKQLPIATRIFGPIPRELRQKKYMKVVSIAQGII
jgi:large subunit ribosomal protein L14